MAAMIPEPLIAAVLQACRAATVTSMAHSTLLVTPAPGGVLRRALQLTPGSAPCTMTMAVSAGTPPLSNTAFLFVASGIDNFSIMPSEPKATCIRLYKSKYLLTLK